MYKFDGGGSIQEHEFNKPYEYFISHPTYKNPFIDVSFKISLNNVSNVKVEYQIGDTDGDGACDKNCIENWSQVIISTNGSSTIIGTPYRTSKSAELEVVYTDKSDVVIEDILPDDMDEGEKIPTKEFTVKNKSPFYVIYNVYLEDVLNEFTSGNFKYKVECKTGCFSFDYKTAPNKDGIIIKEVIIAPGQTHTYKMDFKLQGINEPQNYDQGKIFKAKIQIGYDRRS